jgi:hypothetical protein
MTLREALQQIDVLHREGSLFVRMGEPLSLDSTVTVRAIPEEDDEPDSASPPGTKLLMDVSHVAETVRGLGQLLKHQLGRWPNQQELHERFIDYLKNDA